MKSKHKYIINLFLLSIIVFSSLKSYTQPKDIIRFSSEYCRIESRKSEYDNWEKKDYRLYHLVVFDFKNKKINAYHDGNKSTDLDILSIGKEQYKGVSDLSFKCVDEENLQCNASLSFIDNKELYFQINYSLLRITYFFKQ